MKNYYQILGLEKDATPEEIKKTYRKLSLKFHPDKNLGDVYFESRFKEINEAYSVLDNPEKRKIYDEKFTAFFKDGEDFEKMADYLRKEAEKLKKEKEKFESEKTKSNSNESIKKKQLEINYSAIFATALILFVLFMIINSAKNSKSSIDNYSSLFNENEYSNETETQNGNSYEYESMSEIVDSATVVADEESVEKLLKEMKSKNPETKFQNEILYFSIGSTKNDVIEAQGTPDKISSFPSINEEIWYYGEWYGDGKKYYSYVSFKDSLVYDYDNKNEILNIKIEKDF